MKNEEGLVFLAPQTPRDPSKSNNKNPLTQNFPHLTRRKKILESLCQFGSFALKWETPHIDIWNNSMAP